MVPNRSRQRPRTGEREAARAGHPRRRPAIASGEARRGDAQADAAGAHHLRPLEGDRLPPRAGTVPSRASSASRPVERGSRAVAAAACRSMRGDPARLDHRLVELRRGRASRSRTGRTRPGRQEQVADGRDVLDGGSGSGMRSPSGPRWRRNSAAQGPRAAGTCSTVPAGPPRPDAS